MRILFVGNCNHYFNRKLVEELLKYNSELIIDAFSIEKPAANLKLPYNSVFDFSIDRHRLNPISRFPGMYSRYCYKSWNKSLIHIVKNLDYDFIHIQGLSIWNRGIEDYHRKIIITIWGSDFLRLTRRKLKMYVRLVREAHKITFATREVSDAFDKVYHTRNKHNIVKFGLTVFNEIDLVRQESVAKERQKISITIGYNRHPAQQHLKILSEIKKLDFDIKDKIRLVIPLTYGPKNMTYLKRVKGEVAKMKIEAVYYEKFLSEREMAKVCLESDIMIQLQITDAFSGSMQEYLYADNIVVTGRWLNYKSLRTGNIQFYEIGDFKELSTLLNDLVLNIVSEKKKVVGNSANLSKLSSWESNIVLWSTLYTNS